MITNHFAMSQRAMARPVAKKSPPRFSGIDPALQSHVQRTLSELQPIVALYLKEGEEAKAKVVSEFRGMLSQYQTENFDFHKVRENMTFGLHTGPHQDGNRLGQFTRATEAMTQLAKHLIHMKEGFQALPILEFAVILTEDGMGIKSGNTGEQHFYLAKLHTDEQDLSESKTSLVNAKLALRKQIAANPELSKGIDTMLGILRQNPELFIQPDQLPPANQGSDEEE